ncbi:hypothetical protein, partial [Limnohabitans sp.]|uniref:hypothetical protein n=1 Tax=Limnohabitans sp. TaxID=1907725 RepID=UPI0031FDEAD9
AGLTPGTQGLDFCRVSLEVYSNTPAPEFWKTIWAEEFNSFLRQRLGRFLLNNEPTSVVIKDLNDKINQLNKKYKLVK